VLHLESTAEGDATLLTLPPALLQSIFARCPSLACVALECRGAARRFVMRGEL
jgi:hypothetical protein